MYTRSGRIEYHFRGGPLDSLNFSITEQVLHSHRNLSQLIAEIICELMPDLVEISTVQWPDYESLVLDTEVKRYFYKYIKYQNGHHHYKFMYERSVDFRGMNRLINRDPVFTPGMLRNAICSVFGPISEAVPTTPEELEISDFRFKSTEVPTTRCFECGKEVPISDIYTKKSDPNYALCEPCFRIAERAGRAKEVGQ